MFIRLVAPPHPLVLFNVTLPDPSLRTNTTPAAWIAQLEMLSSDLALELGLDHPAEIHALDRASWHTALLNEVSFNLEQRTIVCTFEDGYTTTWTIPLSGPESRCLSSLERVLECVSAAAREEEMEVAARRASVHSQSDASTSSAEPPVKHKRQRSLLMSLVSAVKNAISDAPSRRSSTILPLSQPPSKTIPSPVHSRGPSAESDSKRSSLLQGKGFELDVRPPVPLPEPRGESYPKSERLRRHAKSTLVDIVRRHVMSAVSITPAPTFSSGEVTHPGWKAQAFAMPSGGYPAWVARNFLRRTEERMREMAAEAEAMGLDIHILSLNSLHAKREPIQTRFLDDLEDDDDEDDDTSANTNLSTTSMSTETDGSSLHTPVDSPVSSPFIPAFVAEAPRYAEKALPHVPRSPSPPEAAYDVDVPMYNALTRQRSNLMHFIAQIPHYLPPAFTSAGDSGSPHLAVLEIKSRRRAWSARAFKGGANMSLVGLATPFRSSPLARCESVTAESLAHLGTLTQRQALVAQCGMDFGVTKALDSQLFPVTEEEGEDEMLTNVQAPAYDLDDCGEDDWRVVRDYDLESGLMVPSPDSPLTSLRPAPRLRARTTSMRTSHPHLPALVTQSQSAPGALNSQSLLCQPLHVKVTVPLMAAVGGDEGLEDAMERGEAEFTLSMDLPNPSGPRSWDNEVVGGVRYRR